MEDPSADSKAAIVFGTDGWRAPLSTFTTERVKMVGQAVASYLDENRIDGPVAIGYDAREHSRGFARDLADVLTANHRDVVTAERDCPTPALAWTVSTGPYAGGLIITASHNPPEYNGVKFVPSDGTPALPAVTSELERLLDSPETNGSENASIEERDLVEPYLDGIRAVLTTEFGLECSLDGLTIAYDAMHGSGRGVTDEILERCGGTVKRHRCERDASFGGTAPEPVPENTKAVIETVQSGGSDLGIVNDGDADRVAVVTPERGFLDPNVVLAVLYDFLLEHQDGDVVRTVPTSSLVDRIASAHGHTVHETPVGFKWVADAMGEGGVLLGGEESGGYGITSHLRNKDGVLIALVAATAHSHTSLDERITNLFERYGDVHQGRVSIGCPDESKDGVLRSLESDLPETIAGVPVDTVSTVDGFKLVLEDGTWILVRPSGTEPKLRLYAEATDEIRVEELLDAGRQLVHPLVDSPNR